MIEINSKYSIGADALNIILYEKFKTKKGKSVLKAIGYFGTLQGVLRALVNLEVASTQLDTLLGLVRRLDELETLIKNLPGIDFSKLKEG